MDQLWAPWRVQYIESMKPEGCILCEKPKENKDAANYILYRGKHNFIIMNAYPYNPGHLMVAPYRHVDTPEKLSSEEQHEQAALVARCVKVLRDTFNSAGFNTGMNIGKVAGAGIDGHIHHHVVPRWVGDNNFMPVVGYTRVTSQALEDTYNRLKGKF